MPEYPYRVRATPTGALPPLVTTWLDGRYLNTDEYTGGGAQKAIIAGKTFGVVGDGATDDTAAIQAALDTASRTAAFVATGVSVFLPAGRYKITGDGLRLWAGTQLNGEPGTVLVSGDPALSTVIKAFGSYVTSADRELASEINAGDRTITTKTAHGYKVGDVLRLVSQRIATSGEAGEDRLGWATIGGPGPFFSEYVVVSEVNSTTQITLESGVVFNGYRPDNTRESDPDAGTSAKLMKTNGVGDRVIVSNLDIVGPCKYGIRFIRAVDARVEHVRVHMPTPGRAVGFEDVYRTEAFDVHAKADTVLMIAADHAIQNLFHLVAGQSSGFDRCSTTRGTQCFDITYSNTSLFTSVHCYVTNSASFAALFNPVTLHPGTYGCWVTDNNFTECRQAGVSIRSNYARVQNNTISGSMYYNESGSAGAGIYLLEGAGKGSVVSGNIVENFAAGLRINDGGGKPYQGWIGAMITGNTFRNFDVGYLRSVGSGEPVPSTPQQVVISNNTFVSSRNNAVGILTCLDGRGFNGLEVTSNSFLLSGTDSVGVKVTANTLNTVVKGNTFHKVGQVLAWDETNWTAESSQSVVYWSDNTVIRAGIDRFPPPTTKFQVSADARTVLRFPDAAFTLNDAIYPGRWYGLPAQSTVARGFPSNDFDGWVDVHRITAARVQQVAVPFAGATKSRTFNGSAWTIWS